MEETDLIVLSPAGFLDPSPAIAACRAGARGTLDLEFTEDSDRVLEAIGRLVKFAGPRFGLKLGADQKLIGAVRPSWVILAGGDISQLESIQKNGIEVLVEAVCLAEAVRAVELGADGIILKGHEAGGRIGSDTSFVLIQKWRQHADRAGIKVPFWVQGGIGANTASSSLAAGARGVVLDSQLLLARESHLSEAARKRIAGLDGSETIVLGATLGES